MLLRTKPFIVVSFFPAAAEADVVTTFGFQDSFRPTYIKVELG